MPLRRRLLGDPAAGFRPRRDLSQHAAYDTPTLLAIRAGRHRRRHQEHIAWTLKKGAPHTPSPLLVGDELYMVSDSGMASCLDAKTGKVHWQQRLGGSLLRVAAVRRRQDLFPERGRRRHGRQGGHEVRAAGGTRWANGRWRPTRSATAPCSFARRAICTGFRHPGSERPLAPHRDRDAAAQQQQIPQRRPVPRSVRARRVNRRSCSRLRPGSQARTSGKRPAFPPGAANSASGIASNVGCRANQWPPNQAGSIIYLSSFMK